jgi:hypothetical protein
VGFANPGIGNHGSVGKVVQILHNSLTCYNSRSHEHERPGPFKISGYLDGLGMMLTLTNITFNLGWFIH